LNKSAKYPVIAPVDYREYPAPEALRRHIACAWRLREPQPAGAIQTIYPDGRCELIVHLLTPPVCWDTVIGWHPQAKTVFAAQRVAAVRLELKRPLDCVGFRLQPAASASLAAGHPQILRDRIVDLSGIDRAFCRALRSAARTFAGGSDDSVWRLLARRIAVRELDPRIEAAVARIETSAGKARIDFTARAAGMSVRNFQIRFREQVGLTPKEFARLMRLQATLSALDAGHASISEVAADSGFADQAHATRELRRVTGLAPATLRAALRKDRDGDAAVRLAAAFVRGFAG
jgi:AraC-like DNA-binding protein